MISEYILKNIDNELSKIGMSMCEYFGKEYENIINQRINNIEFALVRESGVVSVGEDEVYVGEEPVCVKNNDKCVVALPLNFFNNESNNIGFVHLLLHCVLNDYSSKNVESYNETLIDYIANDMGDTLEKYKVNIIPNKEPIYESNSFYTRFYSFIENYYLNNKEKMIEKLVSDENNRLEYEEKLIAFNVEKEFENLCYNFDKEKENKIIRK